MRGKWRAKEGERESERERVREREREKERERKAFMAKSRKSEESYLESFIDFLHSSVNKNILCGNRGYAHTHHCFPIDTFGVHSPFVFICDKCCTE